MPPKIPRRKPQSFDALAAIECREPHAVLRRAIEDIFIFNRTFAMQFRWTHTGRPTTAATVQRPATWRENWASRRKDCETLALVG